MSIEVVRQARSRDFDEPGEVAELVVRFYADVAQDGPSFRRAVSRTMGQLIANEADRGDRP